MRIKNIKISESERLFGMMIGIPFSPQLILSRKLYETFSQAELEYVLLHEAGHYRLQHGLQEFILALILFFVGVRLIDLSVSNLSSINHNSSFILHNSFFMLHNSHFIILFSNFLSLVTYLLSLIAGIFLGILMVRFGRIHEYCADRYALAKISDPKGMITATGRFRNYYGEKYTENENRFLQFLFYRGNPYDNRIRMAKVEIYKRTSKKCLHS